MTPAFQNPNICDSCEPRWIVRNRKAGVFEKSLDTDLSICDTGIVCVIIVHSISSSIRPLRFSGPNLTVMTHTPKIDGGFSLWR